MNLLVQFQLLKEQIPSWMVVIKLASTHFPSVLSQLCKKDSACLQFKMVDGVRPVTQQITLSTSMARVALVEKTVKEDPGEIMSIYLVRVHILSYQLNLILFFLLCN